MINFSACRLQKGESQMLPFSPTPGKERGQALQGQKCISVCSSSSHPESPNRSPSCVWAGLIQTDKHLIKGKEKEKSQKKKISLLSYPFICMRAPVSHLSFHLFFAHLQIKAIMTRPSQEDILGNLLSLAEITAVCYLKYNGRDWDAVWGFSLPVSLEMGVSLPCRMFSVPAGTWEALMVLHSHLSELQKQMWRYRDHCSLLATAVWNLCCACCITPLLNTISIFLLSLPLLVQLLSSSSSY